MSNFEKDSGQTYDVAEAIKKFLQQMSEVENFNHRRTTIKELLQNADDAQAGSVKIILDEREIILQRSNIPDKYISLLRPSIIFINDAKFRKKDDPDSEGTDTDDFNALCTVAQRHKIGESTSAGRFGMGFNSVYYLTDTPIIFSRREIHIFDLLSHVLDKGKQYNLDEFPKDSGGELGYKKNLLMQCFPKKSLICDTHNYNLSLDEIANEGIDYLSTIIRLPLRTERDIGDKFMYEEFYPDPEKRFMLLEEFADECRKSLLFLKYIKKISISVLKTNKEEIKYKDIIASENPEEFYDLLTSIDAKENYETEIFEKAIDIINHKKNESISYRFLMKHKLSYTDEICKSLKKLERNHEKAVPWSAIAVPISETAFNFDNKDNSFWRVFLPVLLRSPSKAIIHSCFFVGISRNGIEFNENGSDELLRKTHWNKLLVDELIIGLLQDLSSDLIEIPSYQTIIKDSPEEYISLFPDYKDKTQPTNISDYMSNKFKNDYILQLKDIWNESFELMVEKTCDTTIEIITKELLQYKDRFETLTNDKRKFVTFKLGESLRKKLDDDLRKKIFRDRRNEIRDDIISYILIDPEPPQAESLEYLFKKLSDRFFKDTAKLDGFWSFQGEDNQILKYERESSFFVISNYNECLQDEIQALSNRIYEKMELKNSFFVKKDIGLCALESKLYPENVSLLSENTVCELLKKIENDHHDMIDDIDFLKSVIKYLKSRDKIPENINIKFLIKTDPNKKHLRSNGILFIKPSEDNLDKQLLSIWNKIIKKVFPEPDFRLSPELYDLISEKPELIDLVSEEECRVFLYNIESISECLFCEEFNKSGLSAISNIISGLNNFENKKGIIEQWAKIIINYIIKRDDDFLSENLKTVLSLPIHRTAEGNYISLIKEGESPGIIEEKYVLPSEYDAKDCPVDIEDRITLSLISDDKKLTHLFYTEKLNILPLGKELFFKECILKLSKEDNLSSKSIKAIFEYIADNIKVKETNKTLRELYYNTHFLPCYGGGKCCIKDNVYDVSMILEKISDIISSKEKIMDIVLKLFDNIYIINPDYLNEIQKLLRTEIKRIGFEQFFKKLFICNNDISYADRLKLADNIFKQVKDKPDIYISENAEYWYDLKVWTYTSDEVSLWNASFIDKAQHKLIKYFSPEAIGKVDSSLIDIAITALNYGISPDIISLMIDRYIPDNILDKDEWNNSLIEVFDDIWSNTSDNQRFNILSYIARNDGLYKEINEENSELQLAKTRDRGKWETMMNVCSPEIARCLPHGDILPPQMICDYSPEKYSNDEKILKFYNNNCGINDISKAIRKSLCFLYNNPSRDIWKIFYDWIESLLKENDIDKSRLEEIFDEMPWVYSNRSDEIKICKTSEVFFEKELSIVLKHEFWTAVHDIIPEEISKLDKFLNLNHFSEDSIKTEEDIIKIINCLESSNRTNGNIMIQIYNRIARAIEEDEDLFDFWKDKVKNRKIFKLFDGEDNFLVSLNRLYLGDSSNHKNYGDIIYCLNTDIEKPKKVTKSYKKLGVSESLSISQILSGLTEIQDEQTFTELAELLKTQEKEPINEDDIRLCHNMNLLSADNKFRKVYELFYDETLGKKELLDSSSSSFLIKNIKFNKMIIKWLENKDIKVIRYLKCNLKNEELLEPIIKEDHNGKEMMLPWYAFLDNLGNSHSILREELNNTGFEIPEEIIPKEILFIEKINLKLITRDNNIICSSDAWRGPETYLYADKIYVNSSTITDINDNKKTDEIDNSLAGELFRIMRYSGTYLKAKKKFIDICLEHLERPSKTLSNYERSFKKDIIVLYYDQFTDKDFHEIYDEFKNLSDRSHKYKELHDKMQDIIRSKFIEKRRKQVLGHGYTQFSVITELMQNAEDAYMQLNQLGLNIDVSRKTLNFIYRDNRLGVYHNGRKFNLWYNTKKNIKIPAFKNDISGILRSAGSFKKISDENQEKETIGKFGIGFKSVYLITDEPHIHSGQWHFKILSGAIPEEIKKPDGFDHNQTAFILPLIDDITIPELEKIDDNIGRFLSLMPFLEEIQEVSYNIYDKNYIIKIDRSGYKNKGDKHILEILKLICNEKEQSIIRFRDTTKNAHIAIMIDQDGMPQKWSNYFSNDIYCKLPMYDLIKSGIGISHSFDLQSGRTHLILSDATEKCFEDIADLIREIPYYIDDLLYELDIPRRDFARQFWNIFELSNGDESTCKLREKIGQALWDIANNCNIVPTRSSSALIKLRDKKYLISDGLSDRLLDALIELNFCIKSKEEKIIIRDENLIDNIFYRKIRKIISFIQKGEELLENFIESLNIMKILDEIKNLSNEYFSIHPFLLNIIMDDAHSVSMKERISPLLESHKLKSHNNDALFPSQLFFSNMDKKNYLPIRLINFISDDYLSENTENRKDILEKAGVKDYPKLNDLKEWIMNLINYDECLNILQYLYETEKWKNDYDKLSMELQNTEWFIKPNGEKTRLSDDYIKDCDYYQKWKEDRVFVAWLGLKEEISYIISPDTMTTDIPKRIDPIQTIIKISQWWNRENEIYQSKYNKITYGDEQNLDLQYEYNPSLNIRKNWLRLLFTGLLQTLGRTRIFQHRSFIDLIERDGWLNEIADPDINTETWIRFLSAFIDYGNNDQQLYYHWMSKFINIYQCSRDLDVYIESFLRIDRLKDDLKDIDQIRNIRTNPLLSGSGIDAPSLRRTFGMGLSFIIRELFRFGLIRNKKAHKFAYMASKRVRNRLSSLGCDFSEYDRNSNYIKYSEMTHQFFSEISTDNGYSFDPTFNNCFDLPFDIISSDKDLYEDLFNEKFEEPQHYNEF